jgi:exonuclease III
MNTINLRTNVVFGDDMQLPKDDNTTHLISLNINGIRREFDYQDVLEMAQALKTSSVDWAALIETNIDWRSEAKKKVYDKFQRIYHQTKISTSSSNIKYNSLYQPGGTATIVTDKYTGRVTSYGSDTELGRWSFIKILGKGRTIILATVYQVCDIQGQAGSRTAHTQQVSLLVRQSRTVSPRRAFIMDFMTQVTEWRAEGFELVIAGDINEELGNDINGFASISSKHNLVEIIQHRHGIAGEPPTYAREQKRLDYIFVTPGLLTSIKHCGILPYSDVIDSDHRCLFVDFDTQMLLGGDPAVLSPNPVRILHSRDTKGSEQYVKAVDNYMQDHRVPPRMAAICTEIEADIEKGEAIDRDITRSMEHGMNKIRKLYTSPFSDQIRHARLRRRFYKVSLSMLKNHLDLRRQLISIQQELPTPLPEPRTINEAQTLLRSAQQNVREMNKKAAALRMTFLEEQALLLESNNDPKAADIRKRILKAEEITRMFNKLRSYLRPAQQSSLSHVMIPADGLPPKEAHEWQRISDPDEVETCILDRNKEHFGQAEGPFAKDELGTIPFSGTGPLADSIREGNVQSNDSVTQLVLDALQLPDNVPKILNTITLAEFTGKLKNWKETTWTSPITKRHLGHYKCLLRIIDTEKDDDKPDETIERAKRILQAHYNLLKYATKHGVSLRRWRKVVNSMIKKEPGNPRIHRLRVIHLYEADYNLLLGIFWARKLVPQGKNIGLFHENCYGSRPGRSATDPVTLEELQVSISYMSRTNQIIFHNDATSCYDRIIINLANLLARRFGMSEELCRLHGDTLHHMLYYVSTALGISDRSYQHVPDSPIYGTGQGSCASPAVWLTVCSILFQCHQKASHGAEYVTPDKRLSLKLSMAGFVDDTKGQTNDMRSPTAIPLATLVSQMQDDAQLWGDLLHVSGGALEIPKCNFYIMHWLFQENGIPTLDKDLHQQLHLEAGDGTKTTLTNDSVEEAHKTLGTWKSALRTQKKQYEVMLTKSNEYARTILSSPVTRKETWTAYYAVYLPRNTFILPTSYFTMKQLNRIQMRATSATLAKGGYVSTMPRAVVFGPAQYSGMAMRQLWVEQLVQQTQTIVKHIRCPGDCNLMFRIALSWAQLSTGMGFHLLEYPGLWVPQLECHWLTSIRTGLAAITGSIECFESFLVPHAREGDTHIMDAICDCQRFTATQVKQINACRIYLQVLLLSDITTPCGTRMMKNYYIGTREQRQNWPMLTYPRQPKPNLTAWQLWRKALNLLYLQHGKQSLQLPMGRWH